MWLEYVSRNSCMWCQLDRKMTCTNWQRQQRCVLSMVMMSGVTCHRVASCGSGIGIHVWRGFARQESVSPWPCSSSLPTTSRLHALLLVRSHHSIWESFFLLVFSGVVGGNYILLREGGRKEKEGGRESVRCQLPSFAFVPWYILSYRHPYGHDHATVVRDDPRRTMLFFAFFILSSMMNPDHRASDKPAELANHLIRSFTKTSSTTTIIKRLLR